VEWDYSIRKTYIIYQPATIRGKEECAPFLLEFFRFGFHIGLGLVERHDQLAEE